MRERVRTDPGSQEPKLDRPESLYDNRLRLSGGATRVASNSSSTKLTYVGV
jgi:hypothetical protein